MGHVWPKRSYERSDRLWKCHVTLARKMSLDSCRNFIGATFFGKSSMLLRKYHGNLALIAGSRYGAGTDSRLCGVHVISTLSAGTRWHIETKPVSRKKKCVLREDVTERSAYPLKHDLLTTMINLEDNDYKINHNLKNWKLNIRVFECIITCYYFVAVIRNHARKPPCARVFLGIRKYDGPILPCLHLGKNSHVLSWRQKLSHMRNKALARLRNRLRREKKESIAIDRGSNGSAVV